MGRGGKIGITLLVLGVVVAGGLVVADRVAVGVAENRIGEQAKKELVARQITTEQNPKVTIAGFPFLTQVLAGTYQKITIKIVAPKTNNVTLEDINLVAETVHADTNSVIKGTGQVTADRVTGNSALTWDSVRQILEISGLPGLDLSTVKLSVTNDVVSLRLPLDVLGQQVAVLASGTLQIQNGKIQLRLTDVRADGVVNSTAVQRAIDQYKNRMVVDVNVPVMPYKLVIDRVETSTAGISVVASATNVVLAG